MVTTCSEPSLLMSSPASSGSLSRHGVLALSSLGQTVFLFLRNSLRWIGREA